MVVNCHSALTGIGGAPRMAVVVMLAWSELHAVTCRNFGNATKHNALIFCSAHSFLLHLAASKDILRQRDGQISGNKYDPLFGHARNTTMG